MFVPDKCGISKPLVPTYRKQSFKWSLKFYPGNPKLPYSDQYIKFNVDEVSHFMNIFLTDFRF